MDTDPDAQLSSDDDASWAAIIDGLDYPDREWAGPTPAELCDAAMAELEGISARGRMLVADRYAVISEIVRGAEEDPDPWVGADPTIDPWWVDPRGRTVAAVQWERRDFAMRAAVADVAVRLRMSETTVRAQAFHAHTLRTRCPRLWAIFLGGQVSEQNAVTAAQLAASLPVDDEGSWAAFDEQVMDAAVRLTPGKFRTRARAVRERVHTESLEDRHRRAAEDRGVWVTPELDGMAFLSALLPAADAHAVKARLDAAAGHLHHQGGETRTLAQLRVDVFTDLLTTGPGSDAASRSRSGDAATGGGTAPGRGATPSESVTAVVAITVPVLALLGESSEPATLDGYGPIDLDTAKRLAGSATSWVRILTHPITGTVLDVDRTTYRVPKALRRWLGVQHPVCTFAGCARLARNCHIDHLRDWQHGGITAEMNLAPECERHHRLKHGSGWSVRKDPYTGAVTWTSPTGYVADGDPPPF